ncbi:pyridoxamine 5'-phosphate oxidase family protein [Facklamia sp. DSM 111018]|uniref:Pyridoxamine 5'-phosphate oxidase family protein n=1 Tax=Facklamia lactis TaxID=2749967 RepID=A0ABS0LQW0_9LACT|nr:pyridoxamine 5'-phosphate oxidase family protein [Facklamia lactis]MBG9986523.1 pyridoxamine 5'-phosphate oxidase family protein [Facklamia lactis]
MTDIHNPMRRDDREMPADFAYYVIDKSTFGTLAIPDQPYPYSLPLSIARVGQTLYFHSANEGKKVTLLNDEPKVCISFVGEVSVPNLYSDQEIKDIEANPNEWSKLARTVFTTQFESAIVYGTIRKITDPKELRKGLRAIAKKYVSNRYPLVDKAINTALDRVQVYAIDINHLTGKRKKYDSQGIEMKNSRGWPELYY